MLGMDTSSAALSGMGDRIDANESLGSGGETALGCLSDLRNDPRSSPMAGPPEPPATGVDGDPAGSPEDPTMARSAAGWHRPEGWEWTGAIHVLLSLQAVCGWLPPSLVAHMASSLGVGPRAIQDHFRDAVRELMHKRPTWLLASHLSAIRDSEDFPMAYARLLGLGLYAPYACVEAALWEAPELLLGGLQQRERARRDPLQPCPLCNAACHPSADVAA